MIRGKAEMPVVPLFTVAELKDIQLRCFGLYSSLAYNRALTAGDKFSFNSRCHRQTVCGSQRALMCDVSFLLHVLHVHRSDNRNQETEETTKPLLLLLYRVFGSEPCEPCQSRHHGPPGPAVGACVPRRLASPPCICFALLFFFLPVSSMQPLTPSCAASFMLVEL